MKNNKKRIFICVLAIICITAMSISFAGCSKPAEPLKKYDFSKENVVEIGFCNQRLNDGGSPYGDNIWRIEEGDERVGKGAALLDELSKTSFRTCNYTKMPFTMGSKEKSFIVCIFKQNDPNDTLDYVRIYLVKDDKDEFILEIDNKYYKISKSVYDKFTDEFFELLKDSDRVVPPIYNSHLNRDTE